MLYLTTSPKIQCAVDKLQWIDVFKLIQDTFTTSGNQTQIITKKETDSIRRSTSSGNEHYVEKDAKNYTNERTKKRDELETDFARDSKSCQPPCTKQFSILRPKQLSDDLINYYFQYQS